MKLRIPATLVCTAFIYGCGGDSGPAPCETVVDANITEVTTWGAECDTILVGETIRVEAALDVRPGTTVRLAQGASIQVTTGSLDSAGTEEAPIVFEGQTAEPGFWGGIAFGSVSPDNKLTHTTLTDFCTSSFQFNDWGITVQGDTTSPGSLVMTNVNVQNCAGIGLSITAGGTIAGSTNVSFSDVDDFPVAVPFQQAQEIDPSFVMAGNTKAAVHVTRGRLETTASWQALDVPYQVAPSGGVEEGGALTLEAGVEVQFEQDATLHTRDGSISVLGTADAPVMLMGVEDIAGYWGGLAFQSLSTSNVVQNAVIANAGGKNFQNNEFAVVVTGQTTTRGSLDISDTVISKSGGGGIVVFAGGQLTQAGLSFDGLTGDEVDDRNEE